MILRDGKPYAEVPAGKTDIFNRITTWLQVKTQKPLGTYKPVWARVGTYQSATPDERGVHRWFKGESWRGWYYGQYDERERLIRNGRYFIRIASPGLFVYSIRIGKYRIEGVIGYRMNGVPAFTILRVQTDESAAVVDDPDQSPDNNLGQAKGLMEGWR